MAKVPALGEAEGAGEDAGGGGGEQARGRGVSGRRGERWGEGEGAAGVTGLVREVLKAAEIAVKCCRRRGCRSTAWRGGLTVHMAIDHLVWA